VSGFELWPQPSAEAAPAQRAHDDAAAASSMSSAYACQRATGNTIDGREGQMAIRTTRSAGMLLLAIWLIITGILTFAPLPIPGFLMGALALIAGLLILIGM
jgi:hypothetical protein